MEGGWPDGLDDEIDEHVAKLEKAMGRKLGDPFDPLLVSVRSGAKFSMPGMMDTVLNLGLNDKSVEGLAQRRPTTSASRTTLPPVHRDVRPHRARASTVSPSRAVRAGQGVAPA
jgi:phosphoenolpyruvate synthase/pyruvate phosphate dikinase